MSLGKFRVWCEYTVDGVKHTEMATTANWFLLTQTGQLFSHGPMQPLNTNVEQEYDKLIVEFYTGLKDKNGVDICEGDIVKTKYETMPLISIMWRDGGFYYSPSKKDPKTGRLFCVCEFTTESDEVIGSIHTTPQLLENN